jgi:hypothetical protein
MPYLMLNLSEQWGVPELLLAAVTALAAVVAFLFRLLWQREVEFTSLLMRASQTLQEQLHQLQEIPVTIRATHDESEERLNELRNTLLTCWQRAEHRLEQMEQVVRGCQRNVDR